MALPIQIDKQSGVPVYVQLAERIRLLMREGVLAAGDPLPTVRSLAVALGVNANTVARVYHDLAADELLRLERGRGTFVNDGADEAMGESDFAALEREVLALIDSAQEAGMRPNELCQFIDTRWEKESADVAR